MTDPKPKSKNRKTRVSKSVGIEVDLGLSPEAEGLLELLNANIDAIAQELSRIAAPLEYMMNRTKEVTEDVEDVAPSIDKGETHGPVGRVPDNLGNMVPETAEDETTVVDVETCPNCGEDTSPTIEHGGPTGMYQCLGCRHVFKGPLPEDPGAR